MNAPAGLIPTAPASSAAAAAAMTPQLVDFTHVVAHDLRAPVRAISGFATLLQQPASPEEARHYLARIQQAAQQLNAMLDGLKRLALLGEATLQADRVNITDLCLSLTDELAQRYPQQKADTHVAAGLWAHGDATLLRAALLELLDNAWKYSRARADASIQITGKTSQDLFTLCIRDNGMGMDLNFAKHLFAPFQHFQSDASLNGIGMGLAIAHEVMRRHQGHLRVAASSGQGAAFFCTLPAG